MRTIDKILMFYLYTNKENIIEYCNKYNCCNGCGGKGGINFDKLLSSLPYFQNDKGEKLLNDLKLLCYRHDIEFYKGGNIIDFIKVNIKFSVSVFKLIHWTNIIVRVLVFIVVLIGLNLFGIKYYKWM